MARLRDIAKDVLTGKVILSEAELANERIKVCETCDQFKKLARQCAICSCFMDLKVRLLEAHCPIEKW